MTSAAPLDQNRDQVTDRFELEHLLGLDLGAELLLEIENQIQNGKGVEAEGLDGGRFGDSAPVDIFGGAFFDDATESPQYVYAIDDALLFSRSLGSRCAFSCLLWAGGRSAQSPEMG